MSAAVFTLATLLCGWAALAPIRKRLGTLGFHIAAYPIGLMGWCVVALVGGLTGGPWSPVDVALGLIGASAIIAGLARLSQSSFTGGNPVPRWTYLGWGGVLIALAWAISVSGITQSSYDAVFHYASWGVWLADGGGLTEWIVGAYGPLIPAVSAGGRVLGAGWVATPWPLLSLHVLALVYTAVRSGLLSTLHEMRASFVAIAACGLLASTTHFAGQVLYPHSHMVSATYLLLSVFAVWRALGSDAVEADSDRPSWLLLAGLATAGLAFSRVDGLAYAAVPLAVAGVLRLRRGLPGAALLPAVLGAGLPLAAYYGLAFALLGGWDSDKLSGRAAAYVLIALALLVALVALAERLPLIGHSISTGPTRWVLAASLVAISAVGIARWDSFSDSAVTMYRNLTEKGGYGVLWFVAAAMMLLSLLTWRRWRTGPWPGGLALAIAVFFATAIVVHGSGHPGRLGPADSFTRVAFHVLPLVFWYWGLFAGSVLASERTGVAQVSREGRGGS